MPDRLNGGGMYVRGDREVRTLNQGIMRHGHLTDEGSETRMRLRVSVG